MVDKYITVPVMIIWTLSLGATAAFHATPHEDRTEYDRQYAPTALVALLICTAWLLARYLPV